MGPQFGLVACRNEAPGPLLFHITRSAPRTSTIWGRFLFWGVYWSREGAARWVQVDGQPVRGEMEKLWGTLRGSTISGAARRSSCCGEF